MHIVIGIHSHAGNGSGFQEMAAQPLGPPALYLSRQGYMLSVSLGIKSPAASASYQDIHQSAVSGCRTGASFPAAASSRLANRIFEMRLYNFFLSEAELTSAKMIVEAVVQYADPAHTLPAYPLSAPRKTTSQSGIWQRTFFRI